MSVKTILSNDVSSRQNLKLCALAMAEYYASKERILKEVVSSNDDDDRFVSFSVPVSDEEQGMTANQIGSFPIGAIVHAINEGEDTVVGYLHTNSSSKQVVDVPVESVLMGYAESVESAAAYSCFFNTIAKSVEKGVVEVSDFINSITTKISNTNSGIIDHLSSILDSSTDPNVVMQVACNQSYQPDLTTLVFNEDNFGAQNLFLSAVDSIVSDITEVWNKALDGVKKIGNFCKRIGSVIGKTVSHLIEMFIPNVLQDYELNKSAIGVLDVPIASFVLPEADKAMFLTNNGDVSGYSNSKKYSGLRYTTGSQYYMDFSSSNGGWDNFFYNGLDKMLRDVDQSGIIEIPFGWGVLRVFKTSSNYYFYLYPQFEGEATQGSDINASIAIPNASNEVVMNKILDTVDHLVEYMGKFPIVNAMPTWPSSDDYNDFVYWYNGDPSGSTDLRMCDLFIDRTLYNADKCRASDLVDAVKYKNVSLTNLNMNGASREQLILTFILFQCCYIYDEARSTIGEGDFGLQEIYTGNLTLGDDLPYLFADLEFIPYYTAAVSPTYVHAQTDSEIVAEIKQVIIMVIAAAAAAALSATAFKIKRRVKNKALYKQARADYLAFEIGSMDPSNPDFTTSMSRYRKVRKSANIWAALAGVTGQSVANFSSVINDNNTLTDIIGLIAG